MVNYSHQQHDLDRVFATLADPTRRAILARLAREESCVSQRPRRAVLDQAARRHEAPRRARRRRPDHAHEARTHRRRASVGGAAAGTERVASRLRAILVAGPRPPRRVTPSARKPRLASGKPGEGRDEQHHARAPHRRASVDRLRGADDGRRHRRVVGTGRRTGRPRRGRRSRRRRLPRALPHARRPRTRGLRRRSSRSCRRAASS